MDIYLNALDCIAISGLGVCVCVCVWEGGGVGCACGLNSKWRAWRTPRPPMFIPLLSVSVTLLVVSILDIV